MELKKNNLIWHTNGAGPPGFSLANSSTNWVVIWLTSENILSCMAWRSSKRMIAEARKLDINLFERGCSSHTDSSGYDVYRNNNNNVNDYMNDTLIKQEFDR